ncbi:MAG: nucleotidyltransferase family protein [Pelagibacteraceae bacterium]
MISAILLAAGQSKRIPEANKLLIKYKNKFLINHILGELIKSKVNKIFIVLGYDYLKVKKNCLKNKKIFFVINKKFKKGISSSIKSGIKKIQKNDQGFLIVQSDMPFIKSSHINKIYNSIKKNKKLVHILKFNNKIGNPIGFNISVIKKFSKIKGDIGAKYLVKRLKKETNFIPVNSDKLFKDFDKLTDFSF